MKEPNDDYTMQLDKLTDKYVSVYLYRDVQNIEVIHQKVIDKELLCCIVKANLILDPFQITIAANKAALNEKYNQLVTRNLFTELIYCLSISKNISQSLQTFGISSDTKDILVVLIYHLKDKESLEKLVFDSVDGKRDSLKQLSSISDVNLIKKTYKVDENELKASSLLDSIVSKMSDKISK